MDPAPESSSPRRALLVLVAVALAIRVYIQLLSPVIAADSAVYLRTAELMREGRFDAALDYRGLHPLYPAATAIVGLVVPRLDLAGTFVSIVAGAAVVWPLHALFALFWPRRQALAACLVYALHPVLAPDTSEAVPTAMFLFFFIAALSCGWAAIRGGRWFLYPAAGACAGLAYLTRTEGLAAPFFLSVAVAVSLIRRAPPSPRRRLVIGALAALSAGALLSLPYVTYLSRKAGRFTITAKGGGAVLLRATQGERVAPPVRDASFPFVKTVTRTLLQAFFPALLPFLACGLWLERKETRRRLGHLTLAVAALAPPIVMFSINSYYRTSPRYFLAGVTLLLPWSSAAMLALIDAARRRFPALRAAAPVTVALLGALLAGRNLLPHRLEDRALKDAGDWLAAHSPGGHPWTLASTSDKVSWYAGAENLPLPSEAAGAPEEAKRRCLDSGASLVAVDSRSAEGLGGAAFLGGLEQVGFQPLESFSRTWAGRTLTVRVYRLPSSAERSRNP